MNAFESTLERDFLLLLDSNPDVESFEEQPISIEFRDEHGQRRKYNPDVFVCYKEKCGQIRKPMLCEVKYHEDLRENWQQYERKFRAAQSYSCDQGWRFRLVTEKYIRSPYLENIKFLREYRMIEDDCVSQNLINATLRNLIRTTPKNLIESITKDRWHQAELLPTLWRLVSLKLISANLDESLTMQSQIWIGDYKC
jgi:hypothetical protein